MANLSCRRPHGYGVRDEFEPIQLRRHLVTGAAGDRFLPAAQRDDKPHRRPHFMVSFSVIEVAQGCLAHMN
jgi:hypothetical protein